MCNQPMVNRIGAVIEFIKKAHDGQVRKYTGEPYYTHPVEVYNIVRTYEPDYIEMHIAALFHDIIEDTKVGYLELRDILADLKFTPEQTKKILNIVQSLTKTPEMIADNYTHGLRVYNEQLRTAVCRPEVHTIKLADILHNCSTIVKLDPKYASRYITEKIDTIRSLSSGNHFLMVAVCNLLNEAKKELEGLKLPDNQIKKEISELPIQPITSIIPTEYLRGSSKFSKISTISQMYRASSAIDAGSDGMDQIHKFISLGHELSTQKTGILVHGRPESQVLRFKLDLKEIQESMRNFDPPKHQSPVVSIVWPTRAYPTLTVVSAYPVHSVVDNTRYISSFQVKHIGIEFVDFNLPMSHMMKKVLQHLAEIRSETESPSLTIITSGSAGNMFDNILRSEYKYLCEIYTTTYRESIDTPLVKLRKGAGVFEVNRSRAYSDLITAIKEGYLLLPLMLMEDKFRRHFADLARVELKDARDGNGNFVYNIHYTPEYKSMNLDQPDRCDIPNLFDALSVVFAVGCHLEDVKNNVKDSYYD